MLATIEDLALRRFEALYDELDLALDAGDAEGVASLIDKRTDVIEALVARHAAGHELSAAQAQRIAIRERSLMARMSALRAQLHAELGEQRTRGRAVLRYAQQDSQAATVRGQRG